MERSGNHRIALVIAALVAASLAGDGASGTEAIAAGPSSRFVRAPQQKQQARPARRVAPRRTPGFASDASSDPLPGTLSLTDKGNHVPPDYLTMTPPPAGGSYVDPVFGTTITRLTDAGAFATEGLVPEYSQTSSWNLDDTYLLLFGTTGGNYELFNANGGHIRQVSGVREYRWSRIRRNYLYYPSNATIWRYDANTGNSVEVANFSGEFSSINFGRGQGDLSDNDRIAVIANDRFVFVYDLATGTRHPTLDTRAVPLGATTFNAATIAKDGASYVITWNANGSGRGRGLEQYGINGTFMAQLLNASAHMGMGRDVDGTPVLFTTNVATGPQQPPTGCSNGIVKVSLDGNARLTCLLGIVQAGGSWGISKHLSGHGGDGWVYVSTYRLSATTRNWSSYDMEIFRARADGSVIERLVHHRTSASRYWNTPHANISISGRKLVYGSDFLRSGQPADYADTYVVDLAAVGPPAAARPLRPSGNFYGKRPAYEWGAVAGATRYQLWIDGPAGNLLAKWFTSAAANCVAGTCSVTPGLSLADGNHSWWLRTSNLSGDGPWSATKNFAVVTSPPAAADPIAPSGGATTGRNPTFRWNAAPGASWYYLWITDLSTGVPAAQRWYSSGDANCSAGTCSKKSPATLGDGTYRWWIRAWNPLGEGVWSAAGEFKVVS